MTKVDYISLALFSKEGEDIETNHYKQSKGRSYMKEGQVTEVKETKERRSYIKDEEGTSKGTTTRSKREKSALDRGRLQFFFLALSYCFDLVLLNFLTWFISLFCHQCQRGILLTSD